MKAERAKTTTATNEPLDEFIYRVSPRITSVEHMRPLIDALERADRERVRLLVSTPPQHGKSTIAFHWLARNMLRADNYCMYLTYSAEMAAYQMRRAKRVAEAAGVPFRRDSRSLTHWVATNGSEIFADGLGGGIPGKPAKRIVIDDPIKSPSAAASLSEREKLLDNMRQNVLARAHEDTSIVVVHTRWHPNDLIGTLAGEGWEYVNLPAIGVDENGNDKALWPEERGLEYLYEQRKEMGDFAFAALYQGEPRPRGGRVFEGVRYYDSAPNDYRAAIGIDLAYTARSSADYSVSVVLAERGGKYYVLGVDRRQVSAPDFAVTLKQAAARYPHAPMRWTCAGTEKGAADLLISQGLPLTIENATTDKFNRAQFVAAAWNRGDILVPRQAPWLQAFLAELLDFTGVNDYHDDQVDAFASAFSALRSSVTGKAITGLRRTTADLKGYY